MKNSLLLLFFVFIAISVNAQTKQEADSLHNLGRDLLNAGNTTEGRKYSKLAMDMRLQLFGETDEGYLNSLNNYANTFTIEGNYTTAIELLNRVLELCSKRTTPHPNIGMFVLNMGRTYYKSGDNKKASEYWEQALPLVEKHSEQYEYLLNSLATIYYDLGDNEATYRIMGLMEEHNKHELEKPCNEPECMLERAAYFSVIGDKAKAKEHYLSVLAMPLTPQQKLDTYEAYANFLSFSMKDLKVSAEYYVLAAEQRKNIEGKTEDYAENLFKAAQNSFLAKEYNMAIELYQSVIDFYSQPSSESAYNIAICNKGIANSYLGLKRFSDAVKYYAVVVEYYKNNDKESDNYPKAILSLAKAEKFNKDYFSSIEHHKEAMQIFEEREMYEEYSEAANSLQLCYRYIGSDTTVDTKEDFQIAEQNKKLDEIINTETADLDMTRTYLGKLIYSRSLATIAGCYAMKEDYDNAVSYYKQYVDALRDAVCHEFRLQSEAERSLTWNNQISNIRELEELLVILPIGKEYLMPEISATIYDAQLLSKGILLNSSIEFEKLLREKGDKELEDMYLQAKKRAEDIKYLRNAIANEADLERIAKLSQENQTLQLSLYKRLAEYADFTDYMSYTWKDVQAAMSDDDIAIEFVSIEIGALDSENYMAAILLTKNMDKPVALPVCTLSEAKAMEKYNGLFENEENLVWGRFKQYLDGKKRICFSADGVFNRLGIEYLKYDGQPLSEQFEVYRLSSTKELCKRDNQADIHNVVLIGDIDYNDVSETSNATESAIYAMRGDDNTNEDIYLNNLENTKKEIDEIEKIVAKTTHINTVKLGSSEASAATFRKLSGTSVNLLHIATHGIYRDIKGASDIESMDNSLLAFAGANLGDTALVSANAIAKMNLRKCDMVVLSACETGLGKLSNDGVFGLQRGFKNAGVRTLLMSLKNVYDNTTAELMIVFYEYLMSGKYSKREALVEAQRYIRKKGFVDSKYWATFVLLDAL